MSLKMKVTPARNKGAVVEGEPWWVINCGAKPPRVQESHTTLERAERACNTLQHHDNRNGYRSDYQAWRKSECQLVNKY